MQARTGGEVPIPRVVKGPAAGYIEGQNSRSALIVSREQGDCNDGYELAHD